MRIGDVLKPPSALPPEPPARSIVEDKDGDIWYRVITVMNEPEPGRWRVLSRNAIISETGSDELNTWEEVCTFEPLTVRYLPKFERDNDDWAGE